jgi:hypothetical protein
MSVGYKVVAVDETNHPQARVNIYAVSLNNYPTISAIVEANEAGEAVFTGLDGPHFFWAQEIRTSTTVGERTYSGKLHVQVVSLNNAPCYDFVVDQDGMGTHTTIQSALNDAGALPANTSTAIFICPGTYDEELDTNSVVNGSLILQGAGQGSVIVRPVSVAGSKVGPVLNIVTQVGGENAVVIDGISFDGSFLSGVNPITLAGGGAVRVKLSRCLIRGKTTGGRGIDPGNSATIGWDLSQVNFQVGTGVHATNSLASMHLEHCVFEAVSCDIGIHYDNSQFLSVVNCLFSCTGGTGIEIVSNSRFISIIGCKFWNETTGIKFFTALSTSPSHVTITGNVFYDQATAIDYSAITASAEMHTITGNTFERLVSGDIGIRCHAALLQNSTISSNVFGNYLPGFDYTTGNEINGITAVQAQSANTQIVHNTTSNPTPIIEWGIGHGVSSGGSGGPGMAASSTEPFVTIGNPIGLAAERALVATVPLNLLDTGPDGSAILSHRNLQELPNAHHNQLHTKADHSISFGQFSIPFTLIGVPPNGYTVTIT